MFAEIIQGDILLFGSNILAVAHFGNIDIFVTYFSVGFMATQISKALRFESHFNPSNFIELSFSVDKSDLIRIKFSGMIFSTLLIPPYAIQIRLFALFIVIPKLI